MTVFERSALVAYRGIRAAVAAALPGRPPHPLALYLLVNLCDVPAATAARAVGCTKQNVSKIVARIEDLREDAAFDRTLAGLERELVG